MALARTRGVHAGGGIVPRGIGGLLAKLALENNNGHQCHDHNERGVKPWLAQLAAVGNVVEAGGVVAYPKHVDEDPKLPRMAMILLHPAVRRAKVLEYSAISQQQAEQKADRADFKAVPVSSAAPTNTRGKCNTLTHTAQGRRDRRQREQRW